MIILKKKWINHRPKLLFCFSPLHICVLSEGCCQSEKPLVVIQHTEETVHFSSPLHLEKVTCLSLNIICVMLMTTKKTFLKYHLFIPS